MRFIVVSVGHSITGLSGPSAGTGGQDARPGERCRGCTHEVLNSHGSFAGVKILRDRGRARSTIRSVTEASMMFMLPMPPAASEAPAMEPGGRVMVSAAAEARPAIPA
ncbi:MAG TPA: hypothetical protein VMM37_08590 [Bacteroidota bacterium]|nr:hypothetical protein [Bacteroidota bacterium]